jgi:hypothetical protein
MESRKRVFVDGKLKRKLEKYAQNKNMSLDDYIDFLFKDFPGKLDQEGKEATLHSTFNA